MMSVIAYLIAKHDGQLTWYQVDRSMSLFGLVGGPDVMHCLQYLKQNGFVVAVPPEKHPQPKYFITDKGRAFVAANPIQETEPPEPG